MNGRKKESDTAEFSRSISFFAQEGKEGEEEKEGKMVETPVSDRVQLEVGERRRRTPRCVTRTQGTDWVHSPLFLSSPLVVPN